MIILPSSVINCFCNFVLVINLIVIINTMSQSFDPTLEPGSANTKFIPPFSKEDFDAKIKPIQENFKKQFSCQSIRFLYSYLIDGMLDCDTFQGLNFNFVCDHWSGSIGFILRLKIDPLDNLKKDHTPTCTINVLDNRTELQEPFLWKNIPLVLFNNQASVSACVDDIFKTLKNVQ